MRGRAGWGAMFGMVQCCTVKGMLPNVIVMHGVARLCYHIGGNPSVHNRGKPGVKPGSDYNPITPFTFAIGP